MAPPRGPHDPVMLDEVVELLAWRADRHAVLVDATLGAAGHAAALLAASSEAVHLIGFDRDPDALELAGRRLAAYTDRTTLVHAPFDELAQHVAPVVQRLRAPVVGVLYDLGVSSMQLDQGERGFSFRSDAPLDMRMDPTGGTTAAQLLQEIDEAALTRIIRDYGEDRLARRIARAVVRGRPATTRELADLVAGAYPAAQRHGPVHPATRTFQALRIAVNGELDRLSASLPQALDLLAPADDRPASAPPPPDDAAPGGAPQGRGDATGGRGGRVAVLAYHSLEDRIVKRAFADAMAGCICPPDLPVCGCGRTAQAVALTRGAQQPSASEIARNPRARSARLRAVERSAVDRRTHRADDDRSDR